jgi:uncharacterized protein (TIGR00290 family)
MSADRVQRAGMKRKALLSWSSGKDSAWSLHVIRQRDDIEVVGLVTTVNRQHARVAMHAVREELLDLQAQAAGLPLFKVPLPWPCSNDRYEAAMGTSIARAREEGITAMIFGDLFLEDIRRYREEKLAGTGIEPLFPLWKLPTDRLARDMLAGGLRAVLTCIDPRQLAARFVGRDFDETLLGELPAGVDPCGERGEFHTFAWAGPMLKTPVPVCVGEIVERDGFAFADLMPGGTAPPVEGRR